jgi:23S rRNA (cytosine1962-C5)-methyltransferase
MPFPPDSLSTNREPPTSSQLPASYQLLDTGAGLRLERFGACTLVRPCRLALWKQSLSAHEWQAADARYDHKAGWIFSKKKFEQWDIESDGIVLRLRLQSNGQVGVFPEHWLYAGWIAERLRQQQRVEARTPKVLNLFAFSGMATIVCARAGAQVTHVDISKRALEWASTNFELNSLSKDSVRLIREDALAFMAKEQRRGNRYDCIIADPPSFSRVSDSQNWELEQQLPTLLERAISLLAPQNSSFLFTSHLYEFGEQVMENLTRDAFQDAGRAVPQILTSQLILGQNRKLPAGFLVIASTGDA